MDLKAKIFKYFNNNSNNAKKSSKDFPLNPLVQEASISPNSNPVTGVSKTEDKQLSGNKDDVNDSDRNRVNERERRDASADITVSKAKEESLQPTPEVNEEEFTYKHPPAKVNLNVIHVSDYRKRRRFRMMQRTSLEDGIVNDRSLTDVLFIVIYFLYVFGMVFTMSKAYSKGDNFRLIYGIDSFGNTCNRKFNDKKFNLSMSGIDTDSKKYLFFLNPEKKTQSNGVKLCVVECLQKRVETREELFKAIGYYENMDVICKSVLTDEDSSECAILPRSAAESAFYRCIPYISNENLGHCNDEDATFFTLFTMDMEALLVPLVIVSCVSIVISAAMLLLLGFLPHIVLWIMFLTPVLVGTVFTIFLWHEYSTISNKTLTKSIESKKIMYFWLALFASLFLIISIVVIVILRKTVRQCVPLFKEAGAAIRNMPSLLLQPIFIMIVLSILFGIFTGMFLYVETVYIFEESNHNTVLYRKDSVLKYMKWYFLIGLVWTIRIFMKCEIFIVYSAISEYFFNRNKVDLKRPVNKAMKRMLLYHFGSLTYAAFVLNPAFMLYKVLYRFISKKLKNKNTECAVCMKDCCCCCFDVYDGFFKYLHPHALVMIAIYGTNFLDSCKSATYLTANVGGKFRKIKCISKFIIFMCQIGITGIALLMILKLIKDNKDICLIYMPLLLIVVGVFFISSCFLNVYEAALSALFVGFCEDVCRNNGTKQKPYFMNMNMKDFLKSTKPAVNEVRT